MNKALFLPLFIIVGLLAALGIAAAALGIAIKANAKQDLSVDLRQTAPARMHIVFTTTGEADWDEVESSVQLAFPPGALRDVANQDVAVTGALPSTLEGIDGSGTVDEGSEGLRLPNVPEAGVYAIRFVMDHGFSGVQEGDTIELGQYMWVNNSLRVSTKRVLDLAVPSALNHTLTTSYVVKLNPTDKVYFALTGTPSDTTSPSPSPTDDDYEEGSSSTFLHSIDRDPNRSYIRLEALPPTIALKAEVED